MSHHCLTTVHQQNNQAESNLSVCTPNFLDPQHHIRPDNTDPAAPQPPATAKEGWTSDNSEDGYKGVSQTPLRTTRSHQRPMLLPSGSRYTSTRQTFKHQTSVPPEASRTSTLCCTHPCDSIALHTAAADAFYSRDSSASTYCGAPGGGMSCIGDMHSTACIALRCFSCCALAFHLVLCIRLFCASLWAWEWHSVLVL